MSYATIHLQRARHLHSKSWRGSLPNGFGYIDISLRLAMQLRPSTLKFTLDSSLPNSLKLFADAGALLWRTSNSVSRLWLGAAFAVAMIGAGIGALAPLALMRVVEAISRSHGPSSKIAFGLGAYVGILVLQRFCGQVQRYTFGRGENLLLNSINLMLFEHLLRSPLRLHHEGKSGATFQTLANANRGAQTILHGVMHSIFPPLVQLVAAAILLGATLGWAPTTCFLVTIVAYVVVSLGGIRELAQDHRKLIGAGSAASAIISDALINIEAIKSFSAETRLSQRYGSLLADQAITWRAILSRRFVSDTWKTLLFGTTIGVTLMATYGTTAPGASALGSIVLLNSYVFQLLHPLELLGFATREMNEGAHNLHGVANLLRAPVEEPGQPTSRGARRPLSVTARNVSFSGYDGKAVLQDVSFQLESGKTIAIVGPSGAGKSTLLRLLLRFLEPTSGEILLDGASVSAIPLAQLRSRIAFISQDVVLLNDTIAENIRLAAEGASEEELLNAAKVACLSDFVKSAPEGLNTPVGERGLRLSGGEKQRISIARAALRQADLFIFDEPTAALDPDTEREVWSAMRAVARGASALIVTHRLSTLQRADEILVLDRGRIVQRGCHAELVSQPGLYRRLWRIDVDNLAGEPA